MQTQLMLYMPVIHSGYEKLLAKHVPPADILLLGRTFASEFPVVRKDIRALEPERVALYLRAAYRNASVRVIERDDLPEAVTAPRVIVPSDKLMQQIVQVYGLKKKTEVCYAYGFLRWDKRRAQRAADPHPDVTVSSDGFARLYGNMAAEIGQLTSDWWRQVGAIAVRGEEVLLKAHNEHMPTEYAPYVNGDPRAEYQRGVRSDLTTAIHAEAALIADAARDGLTLRGADLFVSTFPCSNCARLIARSGITRCFFAEGYSVLDGADILRSAGVHMVRVRTDPIRDGQLSVYDW